MKLLEFKKQFALPLLASLVCAIGLCISTSALATPLSNLLHADVVRFLMDKNNNVWKDAWDEDGNAEGIELAKFWCGLQPLPTPEVCKKLTLANSIPVLVDSLFGTFSIEQGLEISTPALYPTKFLILRFLQENKPEKYNFSSNRLSEISRQWKLRYLEMAVSIIKFTGQTELKEIADRFKKAVLANQIQFTDLSPRERDRLGLIISSSHGIDIHKREQKTGFYSIRGLFNATQKYFAVDFARPVEETIITFAHEMVHAANPELETYRNTYKTLFKDVLRIFAKAIGRADAVDLPELKGIEINFSDNELKEFAAMVQEIRTERMEQLKEDLKNPKAKPLAISEEEKVTLQKWIRAGVGLSIENEYKAYGLSLVLYVQLKDHLQLLPPDRDRQEFVERFIAGDDVFVLGLLAAQEPFNGIRMAVFKTPQEQESGAQFINFLELTYLEITKTFLENLNSRFAKIIKENPWKSGDNDPLPSWARENGWNLPTNPYQLLNARVTTASVIRFQTVLKELANSMRVSNTPIMNLSANVLDLSDVSAGELKLLGIQYENSKLQKVPDSLDPKLRDDTIDPELLKYFTLAQWNIQDILANVKIEGKVVAENLLGLRLLKSIAWADQNITPLKITTMGSQIFLQKLKERIFTNPEEMSEERVKELEKELLTNLETSTQGYDQVAINRLALDYLGQLYQLAYSRGWNAVASKMMEKTKAILVMLEEINIHAKETDFDGGIAKIKQSIDSMQSQLKPYGDRCQKEWRDQMIPWFGAGPFSVNGDRFGLMLICYNKLIYAVRLPGDYTGHMTTMIHDGVPGSRVFNGSREIQLFPVFNQPSGGKK